VAASQTTTGKGAGRRFQLRMATLTLVSSSINILVIAPFLMRMLDWSPPQWHRFWPIVGVWIVILSGIAQLMQRAVKGLAGWLDKDAAGTATQEDEVRAFAASIAMVREVLLNSYLLWPVGAACVALTAKYFSPETSWADVASLSGAGALGGAVSSPTVAFLFKREIDPLRARLARAVEDPALRAQAVRRMSLVWKLQGTVLLTTVVPIVVMMMVVQRQIGIIAGEFAHAQQREWLDSDEPENLATSEHAPFVSIGGAWWLIDPAARKVVAQSHQDRDGDPLAVLDALDGPTGVGSNGQAFYGWQTNARGDRVIVTLLPRSAIASMARPAPDVFVLLALSLAIACAAAWTVARDLTRGIASLGI
jgi:hypothetical protein